MDIKDKRRQKQRAISTYTCSIQDLWDYLSKSCWRCHLSYPYIIHIKTFILLHRFCAPVLRIKLDWIEVTFCWLSNFQLFLLDAPYIYEALYQKLLSPSPLPPTQWKYFCHLPCHQQMTGRAQIFRHQEYIERGVPLVPWRAAAGTRHLAAAVPRFPWMELNSGAGAGGGERGS